MTLIESWMDSLHLLEQKNLQPFAMTTLKSILETYKLMFKYFWWLIGLQLICFVPSLLSIGSFFIVIGLQQLLFCLTCIIARSFMVKKDFVYFRSYFYSLIYFVPLLLLSSVVESLFGSISGKLLPFSAWTIFFILFFLEAEKNVKNFFLSAWHALKMIIFNFPLILCVHLVLCIFTAMVFSMMNVTALGTVAFVWATGASMQSLFSVGLIYVIIMIFLLPIEICTYTNIYIKRLQDQFALYAEQSE